ncbi:MAG: hypothetical protein IPN67_17215 [Bacteroidales bacterium]|nr:hypothetical protein [Bacteroidales bacterium]
MMKTLSEILIAVQKIIDTNQVIDTRLQQLKSSGYQIEFNWVKNGNIGDVFYMKKKQVYRIQISASERCGDYDKAYCIVIPVSNVSGSSNETIKIRNISVARTTGLLKNKTSLKNKNYSNNI